MSLNQDNVLGDPDEPLSQSAFGNDPDDVEQAGEGKGKKKSMLPMIAGITVAVGMVLFFGWKIFIAPYMGSNEESAGIQPIPANNQQQLAPAPEQLQGQAMGAQVAPQMMTDHSASAPNVEPVAPSGQVVPAAPAAQVGGIPTQGVNNQMPMQVQQQPQATLPQQAATPIVAPTEQQPAQRAGAMPSDELAKVYARIDSIEKNIASLHDEIKRLAAGSGVRYATVGDKPATSTKKASTKPSTRPVKKPTEEKPLPAKKDEARESKPIARGDLHLKAVLDGRAWFQTKNGESITVSPGEEVRGIGTVKSIDAERGQVVFTNGAVVR